MKVKGWNPTAFIQEKMGRAIRQAATVSYRSGYQEQLRKEMLRIIDAEMAKIFPLIVKLIGIKSETSAETTKKGQRIPLSALAGGAQTDNLIEAYKSQVQLNRRSFKDPVWQPLSGRTVRRKVKARRSNPAGYFEDTGNLKNYFSRFSATEAINRLGVTAAWKSGTVDSPVRGRVNFSVVLGTISINLFPKIKNYLAALADQKYDPNVKLENLLFGSNPVGRKLKGPQMGPNSIHRPLVQPVLSYFLNVGIPNAVIRAVNRKVAIRKTK